MSIDFNNSINPLAQLELLRQTGLEPAQTRDQRSADVDQATDHDQSLSGAIDEGEQVLLSDVWAQQDSNRILLDGSVNVPATINTADSLHVAVTEASLFIAG